MLEQVQIKVMKNGPLMIEGKVEITDENGDINKTKGKMVALCLCAQSAKKPFCDGSHKKLWFNLKNVFRELNTFEKFNLN